MLIFNLCFHFQTSFWSFIFPLKIDEVLALLSLLSTLVFPSTVYLLVRYGWSQNSVETLDALGKLFFGLQKNFSHLTFTNPTSTSVL